MAVDSSSAEPQVDQATFEETWSTPRTFPALLSAVNNQPVGRRFMLTAFIFFLLGGVLALLMRIQLAVPENTFLGPHVYNQLFTMHGSTMMYLFAVPFLEGLALYLLPLLVGSRDVAYPRLSAFGYWCYLFGGTLFYVSFLTGAVPDVGWFGYTPLSGQRFSGLGTDFWLLGLSLVEVAGITAAAEIVVTVLKLRAPGMSLNRLPLLAWAFLVIGVMILFAFTTLLSATVMLELDRAVGTRFFDPYHGGSSLLWQHLFWFFGHPEVYIMFIPATGIVSMIIPVFARRPIVGYTLIAVAVVLTAFVSFGLWVHHMFATGLPPLSLSFFTAASLMIAVASGTQIFAWIATLWGSRPALEAPLLFVLGFVFLFVLGGLTGVMIAVVPFDLQVHDTFFIVAHFHYVLIGGVVFPIFAGIYYWFPKMTGRLTNHRLGLWSFGLTFIGFNLTFFPMHVMGFLGMPRRVYTYPALLGLEWYNLVATAGAFLLAVGFLVFVADLLYSLWRGESAGPNPWGADSLEWSLSSPPPVYSFERPPLVNGRHPLWETSDGEPEDHESHRVSEALAGEPKTWRATLITDVLEAKPQAIQWLPGPTYVPLIAAVGLLVAAVGVLAKLYILAAAGGVFFAGTLIAWLWADEELLTKMRESTLPEETGLPIFSTGTRSTGWWGMVSLLVVLGTLFGVLIFSYFYIQLYSESWPQDGLPLPDYGLPLLGYAGLIGGAVAHALAMHGFRKGRRLLMRGCLAGTFAGGVLYLGLQGYDLYRLEFWPQTNAYASLYYVIAWTMCAVVLVGLGLNGAAQARARREGDGLRGLLTVYLQTAGMYWYFTAAAGALVFLTLYLSPYWV